MDFFVDVGNAVIDVLDLFRRHHTSLRLGIGGAFTTCLSNFRKFRYSRVFLMSGFSSSALSFCFWSAITRPPGRSEYPTSSAFPLLTLALSQSVLCRSISVHCSGTIVR